MGCFIGTVISVFTEISGRLPGELLVVRHGVPLSHLSGRACGGNVDFSVLEEFLWYSWARFPTSLARMRLDAIRCGVVWFCFVPVPLAGSR